MRSRPVKVYMWCVDCAECGGCIEPDFLRDVNDTPIWFESEDEADTYAESWIDGAPFAYRLVSA